MIPSPPPELYLLAVVVQMALREPQKRRHQAEAQGVIEAEGVVVFWGRLDWDADT